MSGPGKNGKPPVKLLEGLKVPPPPQNEGTVFVRRDGALIFQPEKIFTLDGLSELVGAYAGEIKAQKAFAEAMFEEWAKEFIQTLPADYLDLSGDYTRLSVRLPYLNQMWEQFSKKKIAFPYAEIMMERTQPDLNPFALHFPLLCQRRVAAALERVEFSVFLDLVCARPGLCFTHEELYHPNYHKEQKGVLRYFLLLSEALVRTLQHAQDLDLLPELKEFIGSIKSPYRDFYEQDRYYELLTVDEGKTCASIMEVNMAVVVDELRLDTDQVEGFLLPNKRLIPPPFTATGLAYIAALSARNESQAFFESLPMRLLEDVAGLDPLLFTRIGRQLALFTGSNSIEDCLKSICSLGDAIWPEIIEFPEFQQEDVLFRRLYKDKGSESAEAPVVIPEIRYSAVQQLSVLLETAINDCMLDIARTSRLSSHIRGRKLLMPWEGEVLDEELAALATIRDKAVAREGQLSSKLATVKKELDTLEPVVLSIFRKRLYSRDPNRKISVVDQALVDLIETVERLIPELYSSLTFVSMDSQIIDPILAGNFDAPYHFGRLADEVKAALATDHEIEVRERYNHMPSLVDVVLIAKMFNEGAPAKKIRKKLPQHLVDVVYLRERHLRDGVSFEALIQEFPTLATLIVMIKGREQLQESLDRIARELETAYERVLQEVSWRWQSEELSDIDRYLLSLHAFEFIWDWYTATLSNPYAAPTKPAANGVDAVREEGTDETNGLILERKRKAFRPWVERELGLWLQEKNPPLYELLVAARPASVYGLRSLTDMNWNPKRQTFEMIRILARQLAKNTRSLSDEEAYSEFRKLIENIPSPFRSFTDYDRYDFELTTQNLFILSTPQECMFHSEARRNAMDSWIASQESVFLGTPQATGVLGMMIFRALESIDPLVHNKIHSVAINEDTEQLKADRDDMEAEMEVANTTRRLVLENSIHEVNETLEELDIFKYFVRKERANMERELYTAQNAGVGE